MGNKQVNQELYSLIRLLSDPTLFETSIIRWGAPIMSFGDISSSKIATLGINPSDKEFVDDMGKELDGDKRRFHTLRSLGLKKWDDVEEKHLQWILELCQQYFFRNPYDTWFKKLDYIISGTAMSYYFPSAEACHLDLIPYATNPKWAALTHSQKTLLLSATNKSLGLLLKNSTIDIVLLNGKTVVDNLERITDVRFQKERMSKWTLKRKEDGVYGYAYTGIITKVGDIKLGREIKVLGYNHNIQSSYGVSHDVHTSIRKWFTYQAEEVLA